MPGRLWTVATIACMRRLMPSFCMPREEGKNLARTGRVTPWDRHGQGAAKGLPILEKRGPKPVSKDFFFIKGLSGKCMASWSTPKCLAAVARHLSAAAAFLRHLHPSAMPFSLIRWRPGRTSGARRANALRAMKRGRPKGQAYPQCACGSQGSVAPGSLPGSASLSDFTPRRDG